jgi:hypothetical protein
MALAELHERQVGKNGKRAEADDIKISNPSTKLPRDL